MRARIGAAIALVLISAAAAPTVATDVHFGLARSVPAADATVPSPAELQLWFTQVPKAGSLTVRLVDGRGSLVETPEPRAAENDAKEIHVAVPRRLGAGTYTVAWRGIGDDGHIVQGEFGFAVAAQ
jgi:methionine-rich copper-binding protein CopC